MAYELKITTTVYLLEPDPDNPDVPKETELFSSDSMVDVGHQAPFPLTVKAGQRGCKDSFQVEFGKKGLLRFLGLKIVAEERAEQDLKFQTSDDNGYGPWIELKKDEPAFFQGEADIEQLFGEGQEELQSITFKNHNDNNVNVIVHVGRDLQQKSAEDDE